LWVNRVVLVVGRLLPVFPWKRTSSGPVSISQNVLILLQESFWGGQTKFLEPLMRFASGDANSGNERILGTFCVSAN